jgi:hypothetical protein
MIVIRLIRVEVRGRDEVAGETGLTLLALLTLVNLLDVVSRGRYWDRQVVRGFLFGVT